MILLDLLMPVVDGYTFLRERQDDPYLARVPVVVLSAAGIEGLRQAAQLHATAVLSKPLDLEVLSTVIEHVFREWARPLEHELSGLPIGVCPVCGSTAFATLPDGLHGDIRLDAIRKARLKHVLAHSATDIAQVPLRNKLLQLPVEGRRTLALWFYRELREAWGDLDRRGVHSIGEALDSPALHRLWQDAVRCTYPGCHHAPV
jgi:CheY-like chemotaxis protein